VGRHENAVEATKSSTNLQQKRFELSYSNSYVDTNGVEISYSGDLAAPPHSRYQQVPQDVSASAMHPHMIYPMGLSTTMAMHSADNRMAIMTAAGSGGAGVLGHRQYYGPNGLTIPVVPLPANTTQSMSHHSALAMTSQPHAMSGMVPHMVAGVNGQMMHHRSVLVPGGYVQPYSFAAVPGPTMVSPILGTPMKISGSYGGGNPPISNQAYIPIQNPSQQQQQQHSFLLQPGQQQTTGADLDNSNSRYDNSGIGPEYYYKTSGIGRPNEYGVKRSRREGAGVEIRMVEDRDAIRSHHSRKDPYWEGNGHVDVGRGTGRAEESTREVRGRVGGKADTVHMRSAVNTLLSLSGGDKGS